MSQRSDDQPDWMTPDPWELEDDAEARREGRRQYMAVYRAKNRDHINQANRESTQRRRDRRRALQAAGVVGALHDLSCKMPWRCTCEAIPVYRREDAA